MRWLVLVGLLIIGCAAESNMAKFPKPRTRDEVLNIYQEIAASQKRNQVIQPASASGYGGNGGQGSGSPAPVTNVQVTEEDGAPVVAVGTVKFPNTRVTDNSDGSASVVYHWTKTGTVLAPTTAGDTAEIAQTSTTGNALKVSRNLTSGSTDNAVVEFIQDHASDNQVALNIQQHGDRGGLRVIRSGTGAASGATIFASTVDGSAIRGTTTSAGNADYGGEFDRLDAGGYCDFDESSAPAAANGSNVRIYALNGGRMYQIDDSITIGPYGSELYNLYYRAIRTATSQIPANLQRIACG